MEPGERWAAVKQLVIGALQHEPADRDAYLDDALNTLLRNEAKSLLAVSDDEANLFDRFKVSHNLGVPLLSEGDRADNYSISRLLDEGGSSAVYLATDIRNGRKVALKLLSPRASSYTVEEDRALARLSHPSIATLYEAGFTEHALRFVAMEYVDGLHIDHYCAFHRLGLKARLTLFLKVCDAVAYAHQNLVVHRDLKPRNILVTIAGLPKLLDFGIAKLLEDNSLPAVVTRQRDRAFTLAFASPEQISGAATATATDIYSLGILLTLLLTCRLPYKQAHLSDLQRAIRESLPPLLSELVDNHEYLLGSEGLVPEEGGDKLRRLLRGDLDAILAKALRKEPASRYTSVSELADDLTRYMDLRPIRARRGSRRYRTIKFLRRNSSGIATGFIFVLLFALGGARLVQERERSREEALRAETTSTFLLEMFKVPRSGRKSGNTLTAYELADNAAARLFDSPPRSPFTRGTLRSALASIYADLGLSTPARNFLAAALDDLTKAEAEKATLVPLLLKMARLEQGEANYAAAARHLEDALRLDGGNISRAERASLEGHLAFARGAYPSAAYHFKEELNLRIQSGQQNDYRMAMAENNLAATFHALGLYEVARSLYEKALNTRQLIYRADHPAILQSKHNLARLVSDEGHATEAQLLYDEARLLSETDGIYNPLGALVLQNSGECLTDLGRSAEAAYRLYKGMNVRRRFLPPLHPEIAKSLAGLARVAHAQMHYEEAEPMYRQSLQQLKVFFGVNDPEYLTVSNNLGVLLAETGRPKEARRLFEDALSRALRGNVRRILPKTLQDNLGLLSSFSPRNGRLRTVATLSLGVGDPGENSVFKQDVKNTVAVGATLLFKDSFAGTNIDPTKWEVGGGRVSQVARELRIDRTVTDSGGWARTKSIPIDPSRPFAIRRWAKIHPGNDKFGGSLEVEITGYPEKRFGVGYANFRERSDSNLLGFILFRQNANPMSSADRLLNTTNFFEPIFDEWFLEELIVDSRTGDLKYLANGKLRQAFNITRLPPDAKLLTIHFSTWGWWTGHSQYMRDLEVRQ